MTTYRIIQYNGKFAIEEKGMFGFWHKVINIAETVITFDTPQEAEKTARIWLQDEKDNGKVVKEVS